MRVFVYVYTYSICVNVCVSVCVYVFMWKVMSEKQAHGRSRHLRDSHYCLATEDPKAQRRNWDGKVDPLFKNDNNGSFQIERMD